MNEFGSKLKELRKGWDLSVRQFAKEKDIDKSPGYISRIEGRGEIPSLEFVIQVANFFDVDAETLLKLVKNDQLKKASREIEEKHESTIQLYRKGRGK